MNDKYNSAADKIEAIIDQYGHINGEETDRATLLTILREALEIDYQAMKYPPGVTANFHIIEAIVNNRTASRKASLHTMQDKALG